MIDSMSARFLVWDWVGKSGLVIVEAKMDRLRDLRAAGLLHRTCLCSPLVSRVSDEYGTALLVMFVLL